MIPRRRALAALLGAAAGCHRSRRKRVAVIPKGTAHLFWVAAQAGAQAAGREFNLEILWNGPAQETDYTRQVQIVDSMIAQRVDGIAIAAAERQALVAPAERAIDAGIPVAVFDSGLDSTRTLTFIATDNYAAGQDAARTLAKLIGGQGKVAMVMHVAGAQSGLDRERGFENVINREFPKIQIVGRQYGRSDAALALAATENLLTASPDLNGLFASAEPSSLGAARAIKARNLAGKLKFVAFDSSESLIADLRGGAIDALMVQDPFRMGYEAVKAIASQLAGNPPSKKLDMPVRVVRASDLDTPEVKKLLHPVPIQ